MEFTVDKTKDEGTTFRNYIVNQDAYIHPDLTPEAGQDTYWHIILISLLSLFS